MGNLVRYLLYFNLFLLSLLAQAQYTIVGNLVVEDIEESSSVHGVMVQLLSENKILKTVYADAQGNFKFEHIQTGQYGIIISDLEFESTIQNVLIDTDSNLETQIQLSVSRQIVELSEAFISRQKIKEKGDTIVFDAQLFAKGNEKVVEDLLKNIPGLKVEQSGTITVNGKEVEKVMIEGDDFFEKGYKMVTQNMPSQAIDKVEVLQHYSHNSLLKGFEESDKVALNLTLREGSKNQWFGEISALNAVYPENNYNFNGNLMSFGKKNKHYFLTNFNDVGKVSIGDINRLYKTENHQIGDNISNSKYLKQEGSIFGIDYEKYRLNQQKMISLNSIYNLSERVKLKPRITTKWDKLRFNSIENSRYFLANDTIRNSMSKSLNNSTFDLSAGLDWNFILNNQTTLDISSNFVWEKWSQYNFQNLNEIMTQNRIPIQSNNFNQKINFTKQINPKNVWLLNLNYIHFDNDESSDSQSDQMILPNLFETISTYQIQQNIHRKFNYLGGESKWIYKTNKDQLIETELKFQNFNNQLKSSFLSGENLYFKPIDFQNDLDLKITQAELFTKYTHTFSDQLKWITKAGLSWTNFNVEDFQKEYKNQQFFPKFRTMFNWKVSEKDNLRISFQYDNDWLDYTKLHSGLIYFLPNRLEQSQIQPEILPFSSASFRYDHGRFMDSFNFGLESGLKFVEKYTTTKNSIYNNYQINALEIAENKKEWLNTFYINYLFDKLYHFVKITAFNSYSKFENYVNSNESRHVTNNFTSVELILNSAIPNTTFSYSILAKWNQSAFQHDGQKFQQKHYTAGMNFTYIIKRKYWFQFNQQLLYFPDLNQAKPYYFGDAEFSYQLNKYNLGLTFKLKNLTHTKTYQNQYINDFSQTETSYQLLPRMFLLGLSFKL